MQMWLKMVCVGLILCGCTAPRHCQNSEAFALASRPDFVEFAAKSPNWAAACLEGIDEVQSFRKTGSVLVRLIRRKDFPMAYTNSPDVTRNALWMVNRLEFFRSDFCAKSTNRVFRSMGRKPHRLEPPPLPAYP